MQISEQHKRVSDVIATWLTILSVLAGGIFALVQYLQTQQNERISRTMTYQARFGDTRLLQDRLDLLRKLESINPEVVRVLTAKDMPQAEINRKYAHLILTTFSDDEDDESQQAMIGITDFLESVAVCAQQGLCEESAAKAMFENYGKSFFRSYYPYICQKRARWHDPTIGLKLEQFFNPKSVGKSCDA